jgi:hypothetical protein
LVLSPSAAGVEDPPAGHVSGKRQDRGSLVVGALDVDLGFGCVRLGEAVIVVYPGRIPG